MTKNWSDEIIVLAAALVAVTWLSLSYWEDVRRTELRVQCVQQLGVGNSTLCTSLCLEN